MTDPSADAPTMDPVALVALRQHHPAWRLLAAQNAPLIVSFLHRAYIVPNRREIAEPDLIESLEDVLYAQRSDQPGAYPKSAPSYLDDWAAPERGWLRKYYAPGSDDAFFDLTPAAEKAIAWLGDLTARRFVGTESRLLTLVRLLREMVEGTTTDPEQRLEMLRERRAEVDAQIAAIEAGELPTLDDTEIRDRFQQFRAMANELLGDFREVEHNFRMLDREVREQIALWQGSKGELIAEIMGESDTIESSDQGRNFAAFWSFLMSAGRQDELAELLGEVFDLDPVAAMEPDRRLRRVHHDWLTAGEHAQRTVAQLSKQLRRFIDDQAWLENRRIMEILSGVEHHAIALRDDPPRGSVIEIELPRAELGLRFERPLASPDTGSRIRELAIDLASEESSGRDDLDGLFDHTVIDKLVLVANVRSSLRERNQITLAELCGEHPLEHGLAELVAYLDVAESVFDAEIDETATDTVTWVAAPDRYRTATLPRVIIVR